MAVNNYGTNLRVETTVGDRVVDNDEYQATKAAYEHNKQAQPSDNAWATTYKERLKDLYEPETDFKVDPKVLEANKNDLKIKGIQ